MIRAFLHGLITFGDLLALTTLIGVALSCFWLTLSSQRHTTEAKAITGRLCGLLIFCLSAITVSSLYSLINRSSEMSGAGFVAALPVLPTVLFRSHYGAMWLTRLSGIFIAWVVWWHGRSRDGSRLFAAALFSAGAVIAFARSASGHPSDFGDLSPQQLADWLHLLAISSWAGSVLAIAFVFSPSAAGESGTPQGLIAGVSEKFYSVFGPLLAVLVMTGMYNAWFSIETFEALLTTPYGWLFSLKLVFFSLLVFRYITPPEQGRDAELFAGRFLRRMRFDAVIILALLLCVSLLVHAIPARHQVHLERIKLDAARKQHEAGLPEPVVTFVTRPALPSAGSPAELTVSLTEPDGSPLQGLELSHERILHAVIISRDLSTFAHIHPEDIGPVTTAMVRKGTFSMLHVFPKAGEYLIGIDFAREDEAQNRTFQVRVADTAGMEAPAVDFTRTKNFGGYRVSLRNSPEIIRAGSETTLEYFIEKDGRAVTDLEPYLAAAMHLAVVPLDLTGFTHAHGVPPGEQHDGHAHGVTRKRFGPEIESEILFPAPGTYKVFSEVRHKGKVLVFDFMVKVQ